MRRPPLPPAVLRSTILLCGGASLAWSLCACTSSSLDGGDGAPPPPDAPCSTGPGATTLAPGVARGIVVDDAFVYTARDEGIFRVPRTGGSAELLVAGNGPVSLGADDASLYYFGDRGGSFSLFAVPFAGGVPLVLVDVAYGLGTVSDGKTLFWMSNGGVKQVSLADGSVKETYPDTTDILQAMALGRDVVWIAGTNAPPGSGTIRRMPKDGGALTTIVRGLAFPLALALDEERVYVSSLLDREAPASEGLIQSARLDGSDLKTIAKVVATSLAVDAHAVYGATASSIVKIDKSTGLVTELVTGLQQPTDVVLRGGNVYWANARRVEASVTDAPRAIMTACK